MGAIVVGGFGVGEGWRGRCREGKCIGCGIKSREVISNFGERSSLAMRCDDLLEY